MSQSPQPGSRARKVWPVVLVLLAFPIIVPLLVPTYARTEPTLGGFPFFYWYQFLWIPLAAGLTFVCFRLVTRAERQDREEGRRR